MGQKDLKGKGFYTIVTTCTRETKGTCRFHHDVSEMKIHNLFDLCR